MTDADAFRLSRVEAQGWNAARRLLATGAVRPDDGRGLQSLIRIPTVWSERVGPSDSGRRSMPPAQINEPPSLASS
jgi:hypothetical protein